MIDFTDRDVPADVRDRITETVHRELAAPPRRGLRMPLAVAASVSVLAVAGVVTTLSLHDRAEEAPAGPGPSRTSAPAPATVSTAADELRRCWDGVVAEGKQQHFPVRSKWAVVARRTSPSANAIGLRAEGKTFFCLTTTATVTVTDPTARVTPVEGTPTRVMLVDDSGWILAAGVTPGAVGAAVSTNQDYEVDMPADDGLLLIQVEPRHDLAAHARFVGDNRIHYDVPKKIPAVPAPAVERVDRPLPLPDRTSADGRQLGECLGNTGWPKSYTDQWQPGVSIADGRWYAQLATSKGQFGMCVHTKYAGRDGEFEFTPVEPVPAATKPQYLLQDRATYASGQGFRQFAVGTAAPEAAAVTVVTTDGVGHAAVVHDGLWAVVLPASDPNTAPALVPSTVKSVTVKDGAGKVLYEGAPIEVGR